VLKAFLFPLLLFGAAACDTQPPADRAHGMSATLFSAESRPLPELTGRVVDNADILTPAADAALTARLEGLERATTDQLVVVTVAGLGREKIEDFGLRLGNGWRIGQKGLDNGVLLIVARADRRARIEVGKGLEGLLTDERAARIMNDHVVAHCGEGRFERGIAEGVAAIAAVLESDRRRPQRRAAAAA
jgi:uncharacterized protein